MLAFLSKRKFSAKDTTLSVLLFLISELPGRFAVKIFKILVKLRLSGITDPFAYLLNRKRSGLKKLHSIREPFFTNVVVHALAVNGSVLIYTEDGEKLKAPALEVRTDKNGIVRKTFKDLIYADRMCIRRESPFFKVWALFDTADIKEDTPLYIDLRVMGKMGLIQRPEWNELIWHVPEDWEVKGGTRSMCTMERAFHEKHLKTGIIPHNLTQGKYEITLEISLGTFPSRIYVPFVFMNAIDEDIE